MNSFQYSIYKAHIKARLFNFIEKSYINPYSIRNCNKYNFCRTPKAYNIW